MDTASNKRSCRDGNRRMACDRCRAQKLRCIMVDSTSDWCIRCKNADVSCKRGPAGRSGRPRTRRMHLDQGRYIIQHDLQNSARRSRSNEHLNRIWHGGIASKDHLASNVSSFTGNTTSVPVSQFSLHQNERNDPLTSVQYFDSICSGRGFDDPTCTYNDHFTMGRSLAQDSTTSLEGFSQDTSDDTSHDPTSEACPRDNSFLLLSPAYTMQETNSNFGTTPDLDFPQARSNRRSDPSSILPDPSDSAYETDGHSTVETEMTSTPIELYQKLAQLAVQMQSEIAVVSKVGTPTGQDNHCRPSLLDVASGVLERSTGFYDTILSSFWDDKSRVTISQQISRPQACHTTTQSSNTKARNNASQNDNSDKTSGDSIAPSFKPDIAICLQLLASYFQVLELHEVFYEKVCEYFDHNRLGRQELNEHSSLTNLMSPGILFGRYSLNKFPELQWGLLLQTSLYLLGRIEILLGLPQGCRISSINYCSPRTMEVSHNKSQCQQKCGTDGKDAGEYPEHGNGILGLNMSTGLIHAAFREHALKTGEDKITRMQKMVDFLQSNVTISIRN